MQTLWSTGLGIADACYGLLVLIGGIIVMTHETLQTSYSAKEIAPRIVIGFVTANLSMVLMTHAVDLANGLSAAFTAGGVSPPAAATSLMNTLGNSIATGGIFLILLALAGVDPGPGARGGLRDPADGRGAAGRRRPGVPGPVRPAADRLGRRAGGGGR